MTSIPIPAAHKLCHRNNNGNIILQKTIRDQDEAEGPQEAARGQKIDDHIQSASARTDRRVDNGGKRCKRCVRGPTFKHGHDPTCPGSKDYLAHGGSADLQRQWRSEQNNSSSAPTFASSEMCHAITGNRHEAVTKFTRGIRLKAALLLSRSIVATR